MCGIKTERTIFVHFELTFYHVYQELIVMYGLMKYGTIVAYTMIYGRTAMKTKSSRRSFLAILLFVFCFALLAGNSLADGKFSFYGARLIPDYNDADGLNKSRWGGGLAVVAPIKREHKFLAVNIGMEYFNFYKETIKFSDPSYGSVNIQTNQGYYRFYMGGRIGRNGNGLFHPFIGSNIALIVYYMDTDFVDYITGEYGRMKEIRQNIDSQTETVFGYDLNLGAELKLARNFILESGMRYLHSFNVPVQLDDARAITVQPSYLQFYISAGASFHTHQDR
jgi:opacity protein-like surface antigen